MRIRMRAIIAVFILWACGLLGQSPSTQTPSAKTLPAATWNLPQGTVLKESSPRTYRFTVDYNTANTKGEIVRRERITGEYTRGLPDGEVVWKNVTHADADGITAPFGAAQQSDFMEGFHYRNDLSSTLKPEFFKAFPPTAVFERNLVWDVGTFHNRDVVLEWIGRSRRNGQDCAVIKYQAFFNPLEIANAGMTLKGRSDYWGEIWVSLATKQIEFGTLYENVMGEMKLAGQDTTQIINVFRSGTFEPVHGK